MTPVFLSSAFKHCGNQPPQAQWTLVIMTFVSLTFFSMAFMFPSQR